MRFLLIISSILLLLGSCSPAQQLHKVDGHSLKPAAVDEQINGAMRNAGVTGMSIAIVNKGAVAYAKGYGYLNKNENLQMDTGTVMGAASLSASTFAILAVQLAGQKKFDLDKPLYQYMLRPIPQYEGYGDLKEDDRWKMLTARNCLAQTTGFPNWRSLNPHKNNKLEFLFDPGTRFAYSGEGIKLLQLVLEARSGESLEQMAEENIFAPMELKRTSFRWQNRFDSNYARGYDKDEQPLQFRKPSLPDAARSLQTTAVDYARLMAALMRGTALSDSARQEMLSPQIAINAASQFPGFNQDSTDRYRSIHLSYGLGWALFDTRWGPAFFNEGHDENGFCYYVIGVPSHQFALVMLSNSLNAERLWGELVPALSGINIR